MKKATPIKPEQLSPLPPKPIIKSKTFWGVVAAMLGAGMTAVGLEGNAEFLSDGWQTADDFVAGVGMFITIGGWAFKEYGQRVARRPIKGIVKTKEEEVE